MRIIFFLFICILSNAQETNPLDKVRFYDVDDLDWESSFSNVQPSTYYNKGYDSKTFFNNFLAPWKADIEEVTNEIRNTNDFAKHFNAFEILQYSPCYAGNYREFPIDDQEQLINNTAYQSFPNHIEPAITTTTVNIRRLPTHEFCLKDIRNAGEGYPFDYFQESSLWIGTPLHILHESKDHHWYFVLSPYGKGWVPADQVAIISSGQAKQLINKPWATILEENLNLQNRNGYIQLKVGTILPIWGQSADLIELAIPYRTSNGRLALTSTNAKLSKARQLPIPFNSANAQKIMRQLLGGKYGWGGVDNGRDCSSTLKDFFTPFGIWLPRNSKAQKEVGQSVRLVGSESEKMDQVRQRGIPFLTILYKPGHSMLYVGINQKGTPLIFHNVWGIKPILRDPALQSVVERRTSLGLFGINEKKGGIAARYIIGQSVITTIDPEENFPNMEFDGFMKNMSSMNFLK